MNKYLALLVVGLILAASCSTDPDPAAVVGQFQDAINSQDLESSLELLSEDAVLQVDGTLSRTGKAEIENWLATQAELNYRIEGDPIASGSGVAFESCSISSDQWLYFGVNPMSGTCNVALEDGLITRFDVQFDENSKARLSDSPAAERSDLIATWTALGGQFQNVIVYLQFAEDGSARWAESPDDLLVPPDSDHPGALLTWTYTD